jgi:hypothetical protein
VSPSSHGWYWTNDTVRVFAESLDYGDALGHTSGLPEVVSQERFKVLPADNWQTLPSFCNAAQGYDQNGNPFPLEGIFHSYASGPTINIYTAR